MVVVSAFCASSVLCATVVAAFLLLAVSTVVVAAVVCVSHFAGCLDVDCITTVAA